MDLGGRDLGGKMGVAATPTPKDVERALKRLTADQFAQVCSEIGILEVTLPGSTQAAKADALVARVQGHPDFAALVRAIHRIDPRVWSVAPKALPISSLAYGIFSFVAVVGLGGLVLLLVLSGADQAAQVTPTPTATLAPTRTPVPTFTHTPSVTPAPSETPTPTITPSPTRDPSRLASTATPNPTDSPVEPPTPVVSIIYPKIELQRPPSRHRAYPDETVEFRWLLRDGPLAANERYLMRTYFENGRLAESFLTADPWRFAVGGPSNAIGVFTWTVTVVRVDAAGNVAALLSPESDAWVISWQP